MSRPRAGGRLTLEPIAEIRDVLAVALRHEIDEVLIRFEIGPVVSGKTAVQMR